LEPHAVVLSAGNVSVPTVSPFAGAVAPLQFAAFDQLVDVDAPPPLQL
jgi:hypothetical protein